MAKAGAGRAGLPRRQPDVEIPEGARLSSRLSGAHQGDRRRRRARHPPRRRACRFRCGAGIGAARGASRLRRSARADREADHGAAPYRGAGVRRQSRRRRPSLRARLLAATPTPEADRGNAGARPARSDAAGHDRGRRRRGEGGRLCRGGDGGVHRRREPWAGAGQLLLSGDEHPAASRASRHRGAGRRRSRRVAISHRRRREAAAHAGSTDPARRGDRGARQRRGPRDRLPALARDFTRAAARRAWGSRRHRLRGGRRGLAALRFADRQTDSPRRDARGGRRQARRGARPRRRDGTEDQHRVPARAAGRAGISRRDA